MENYIVNLVPMVRSPKKRQPCPKPAPYKRKPKTPHQKDGPATSTKHSDISRRENLTLNDWMMVFACINEHPYLPQDRIVQHFKTRKEGVLCWCTSAHDDTTQSAIDRNPKPNHILSFVFVSSFPSVHSTKTEGYVCFCYLATVTRH
jgi:hypothetical protein